MSSAKSFVWSDFTPEKRAHREALVRQSPAELAKLVALEVDGLGAAAYYLAEDDHELEASLRVFEALLKVPLDRLDSRVACNATYWLATANEQALNASRSRRFLKRWAPLARENPALYLNLAILATQLGDASRAVAIVREGLEQGAPRLRSQLGAAELEPLRTVAGFSTLKKIRPSYPPALRALQLGAFIEFNDDLVEAAMAIDLDSIRGTLDSKGLTELFELTASSAKAFRVFGHATDGGRYAFWQRTKAVLERCPVVYFGADGLLGVCATDLAGFLTLFAHGVGGAAAEQWGFIFRDWSLEKTTGSPNFKVNKRVLKQVAQWLPAVATRNPRVEWQRVLALNPAFVKAIRAGERR